MDKWAEELERQFAKSKERHPSQAVKVVPGKCPQCPNIEQEPSDYDVIGNDVFTCGECGISWSATEQGEKVIQDSNGF